MKIMIATPFKGLEGFSPYIASLAATIKVLTLAGVDVDFRERSGDAYVDRAKNWLLSQFINSDCDYVFMIDSDMSWTVDGVVRMLGYRDLDLVGGTYRVKNAWEQYAGTVVSIPQGDGITPGVDPETGLIAALMLPGGFLRLSRKCVERMYRAYECLTYEQDGQDVVGVFETQLRNVYHGEDSVFCERWRGIRGKLWIEPRLQLDHWGMQCFPGNFHEFLMSQPPQGESNGQEEG